MAVKTVLFDLDGTLLPMDQDVFIGAYFKALTAKLAPHGYAPDALVKGLWAGIAAMVKNDGTCTNEQRFWQAAGAVFGLRLQQDKPLFDSFYQNEFENVRAACGYSAQAAEVVRCVKQSGARAVLATNPVFPAVATHSRISWAGLDRADFEWITTYENIGFCKPNLQYYRAVLQRLGLDAAQCIMVGNDVAEDMVARELGIEVFLLTNDMINKEKADITQYPRGGYKELLTFLQERL